MGGGTAGLQGAQTVATDKHPPKSYGARTWENMFWAVVLATASFAAAAAVHGDYIIVNPPNKLCNVMDYGGVGNGVADDTKAVQAALTACTQGGTVLLPAFHTFLTYALNLKKPTQVVIAVEGTLRFSNKTSGWNPSTDASCLTITDGDGFALTGGGIVDGNGEAWWPNQNGYRPGLVKAEKVQNFLVTNLTFLNSPNHFLELYADPQEVVDSRIYASVPCPEDADNVTCAHNTDGVDVHGSPAWIHRNFISTGDDNVALHANDTLIEDNEFGTGHGASIGSLGEGVALSNITVRRCTFADTVQACRIKVDPTSSGYLRDVTYSDLALRNVGTSIVLTLFYPKPAPGQSPKLKVSNITFENIVSVNAGAAGEFTCADSDPCEAITVRNVTHVGGGSGGSGGVKPWSCTAAYGTVDDVTPTLSCLHSK